MAELTSVFRWWDCRIVILVLLLLERCVDILQESEKEPPVKTITHAAARTFGNRTFFPAFFLITGVLCNVAIFCTHARNLFLWLLCLYLRMELISP